MTIHKEAYTTIKEWKEQYVFTSHSSEQLNTNHDKVFKEVFQKSFKIIKEEHGEPPCEFSWFVLGSAGRFEQGYISDQDHGLVYETNTKEAAKYFLSFGRELATGLFAIGYPYCDGKVMSCNPIWCKSFSDWTEQLNQWMLEESLDSIRYLQIFYDARVLVGTTINIDLLKKVILDYHRNHPHLLQRFLDNIRFIKKSVGVFGQLYVQQNGPYAGSIDLKHAAFLPYVNAIRLLAIKEGIVESSTLSRFDRLLEQARYTQELKPYQVSFQRLLDFRLSSFNVNDTYSDTHYLSINNLSDSEKKLIKQILKDGERLHHFVKNCVEKGC
jgi:CBS domain-containing protein